MIQYETVQAIGRFIGFPYTVFNGRSDIPENTPDNILVLSGECTFYKKNGKKLLIFNELLVCNPYQSYYVINLYKMTISKKSFIQKPLPSYLKHLLSHEAENI
jgi:hypothetical protein